MNAGATRSDLDHELTEAYARYVAARPASAAAHQRALEVLPAGNTRSVLNFAPFPFRVASAHGAEVVDLDGHRYVDFCGNYSAGLLGHSPAGVQAAIVETLEHGWAIGATHLLEVEVAERICARFPTIEQVRFTNSGTEANLMAIGLALHHTGRTTVGVFDHGYHGGVLSFGDLGPAVQHPLNVPHHFHVAEFDSLPALDALFAEPDLGAVVIELVQGSGGCRPVSAEVITEIRRRCTETGAVLIIDEVMTSRLSPGGCQQRYGVAADLTTMGKYLGGGMSFGAFGGRREIMAEFDPAAGGVLTQAGTFNNNVVSMAAARATLDAELDDARMLATNERGDRLRAALGAAFAEAGMPMWVTGLGSMLCVHGDDDRLVELYFHAALAEGLYLARRGFMALSFEITDEHCDRLVAFTHRWAAAVGSVR